MLLKQFFQKKETLSPSILNDDDEMSDRELEVVVGGLARPWRGWDAAETCDTATRAAAAITRP